MYEKAFSSNKLSRPIGIDELFSTNGTRPSINHQTTISKRHFNIGYLFWLKKELLGALNKTRTSKESKRKTEKTFGIHWLKAKKRGETSPVGSAPERLSVYSKTKYPATETFFTRWFFKLKREKNKRQRVVSPIQPILVVLFLL